MRPLSKRDVAGLGASKVFFKNVQHNAQPCSTSPLPLAVSTEPITGGCIQFMVKTMY